MELDEIFSISNGPDQLGGQLKSIPILLHGLTLLPELVRQVEKRNKYKIFYNECKSRPIQYERGLSKLCKRQKDSPPSG